MTELIRNVRYDGKNSIVILQSIKIAQYIRWESMIEGELPNFSEYNPTMLIYYPQPFCITIANIIDDKHSYIPDFQVNRISFKENEQQLGIQRASSACLIKRRKKFPFEGEVQRLQYFSCLAILELFKKIVSKKLYRGDTMPVRKVSNRGGNIIGSFPSLIKGEKIMYESTIERDFVFFLKFDPTVLTYCAQPMVITGTDTEGKVHRYTPDFLVVRTDRKEIIECKPDALLDHPHTQQQIRIGEKWAEMNNHDFVIVTDTDLRKDHTLANLKLFLRYYRIVVPTVILARCIAYLKTQPEGVSFDDIAFFLSSLVDSAEMQQPHMQAPFIYNMLFHHILQVDLTKPISPATILWLSPSICKEMK